MTRAAAGVCLLVGACGRISFDPLVDAPTDAPAVFGPFGAPQLVTALGGPGVDDDPTFTGDLLEVIFDSDRAGFDQLYTARRATAQDPWPTPQPLGSLSAGLDHDPGLMRDGLTIYFSSMRAGSIGEDDLWGATRPDRSSGFSGALQLTTIESATRDAVAEPTPDGLVLFFASDRQGSFDLYVATRASTADPWNPPVALTELNTPSIDIDPFFCVIEDALYFSSDRPGGLGNRDIYRARRTGTWTFAAPERVDEIDTPGYDSDPWLSPDGRTIFFVNDQSGTFDVAMATR